MLKGTETHDARLFESDVVAGRVHDNGSLQQHQQLEAGSVTLHVVAAMSISYPIFMAQLLYSYVSQKKKKEGIILPGITRVRDTLPNDTRSQHR